MALPGVRDEILDDDHSTGGDELAALHRRYHQTRDPRLRDVLVERHAGLVRGQALRFAHRGEDLDDLMQVGFWGLLLAIERFDFSRYDLLISTSHCVAKAAKPRARLVALAKRKSPVIFGALKGKIWIADDFDAPLPDDIQRAFDGDIEQ